MPTPPMLRTETARRRTVPDPLVALNVAGLTVVTVGLLLAAVLAVYDYSTPGAEAPLVLWIAVTACALLAIDLLVVTRRHLRRSRLGL